MPRKPETESEKAKDETVHAQGQETPDVPETSVTEVEALKKRVAELEAAKPSEVPDAPESMILLTQKTREELSGQKKVKVRIPSTETDKDPVVVGINGYVYQIKRDEVVEVPASVAQVLDDAKLTLYVQKKREDGEGNELIETSAQRIPYQRL